MNSQRSLCVVGCGDLGVRLAAALPGDHYQFYGICRSPQKLPAKITGLVADYSRPGDLDILGRLAPDYVIATFSPAAFTPAGYQAGFATAMQNLLAGLGAHRPALVLMVSSTRVYAERDGAWVDEESPLREREPRAAAILAAERALLESCLRATVVRCAGIYGNPQGRLLARLAVAGPAVDTAPRYSNRIHRDDAAGFLAHLVSLAAAGVTLEPVYNGVDDLPVATQEVEHWLADKLGGSPSTGDATPRRAGDDGHKRCRNTLLHRSGYSLLYPDYQSGYSAVLAQRTANAEAG